MNDNNTQYAKKLREQIDTLNKENRYLEFKSNYQDPEKLGKYISALSNGACLDRQDYGYLYFGVEDITLNVKGTTFDISQKAKGNQPLELYLHQYISPKIDFTIEEFFYEKSIRMVRFKIQAARREPTCFKGTPYVRVDSSLTELKQYVEWLRNIYNSDEDWSEKVIPNASLDDLDKEAIKIVRNGYNLRNPEYVEELSQWSDKVFLDKANLTKNGEITRAAMLLVGRKESVYKLEHIAQIVWKCYQDGNTFGEIFTIPFVKSTTDLLHRIRNYQFKLYPKTSLIPVEIWKYDTRSILEMIHNCIAHQDYTLNKRILVIEDNNKLTFESAGDFYDGNYKDYLLGEKTPVNYRNRFLMDAMVNVKMIDSMGYGIHNTYERQKERFLPMPDYYTTDNKVVVQLPGTTIDENYSLLLMENSNISLTESILLDYVQKRKRIPVQAIKELRKKRLIEGRFPNVYIAKNVARIVDKKAEYSKHKGVHVESCEAVILSSLKDHHYLLRKEIDEILWDLMSDLLDDKKKKRKISYILDLMKKKGLIRVNANGKNSTYMLEN